MKTSIALAFAGLLALAAPAAAQQVSAQKPVPAAKAEQTKPETKNEPAKPVVIAGEGMPVNVRLEITITDQRGDAAPIVKTVTKTVADRSWIRIRTGADVQTKLGFRPTGCWARRGPTGWTGPGG